MTETLTTVNRVSLGVGAVWRFFCCFLLLGWGQASVWALDMQEPASRLPGQVMFCVDPDWAPFEQIDSEGQHVGIAADLLRLAAQRSGLNVQLLPTRDWEESQAASQAGRCQLLSFLNQTPKRDAWLVFTAPLLVDENVLITREEHAFVTDLANVSDEIMVLPKGTSIEERVRRDYPKLQIQLVDSEAQAFAQVSERHASMTMRSLIVAADTIKREGWFNLKIAGQVAGYGNQLRVGVLKDQVALRDRLNQGVLSITPIERQQIIDRHTGIKVTTVIDTALIRWLGALLVAVVLTSAYWISRLKKINLKLNQASRTDALTGLQNRNGLDELLLRELSRSERAGAPLSVILLDIDFFKHVNDELGHLVGDRVLKAFAAQVREAVRDVDHVLRWGGEEFLVVCTATDAAHAQALALRILSVVREHSFDIGRKVTASAGVACLTPGQTPDELFAHADAALYQAKTSGRDKAVLYPPD